MMKRTTSALGAAIAATLGSAGAADAAVVNVSLKSVASFSGNGSSPGNITSSTATWQYDDVSGLLTSTGGTFNVRFSIVPVTTLFRHVITGLVLGNGAAASAATYNCNEGNFGTGVGASLCGNYNFGANFTNESSTTWGPATAFARTIGGDDMTSGAQQSIAAYDSFATIAWTGTQLTLSNASCNPAAPGNASGCATTGGSNTGYTWVLVPPQPVANPDTANTPRNANVTTNVLANDVDIPGGQTVTIATPPASGTATVNPDNTITYSPNVAPGTGAPTSVVTYDYAVAGVQATVTVTVSNTIPNAVGGPITPAISTQGVAPDTVSGSYTAPGTGGSLGDAPSTVAIPNGLAPTRGTATVSGTTITYTPNADFFEGTDQFTYQITDGDVDNGGAPDGETAPGTAGTAGTGVVTIDIANLTPALAGGSAETGIDEEAEFDLTDGLTAGNGSLAQHTFAVVVDASNGSCTISGTTLTYTPDAGFSGSDSCEVSITDENGAGETSNATYDIEVAAAGGFRTGDGGSSSLDLGILSLFGAAALLRRRRRA